MKGGGIDFHENEMIDSSSAVIRNDHMVCIWGSHFVCMFLGCCLEYGMTGMKAAAHAAEYSWEMLIVHFMEMSKLCREISNAQRVNK